MTPLQSCLVGQTKPFGEKICKIGPKKPPIPLKSLKWPSWPFSGSCREFLHFHNSWSGAQTINFKVFNPIAKFWSTHNRPILSPRPTLYLSLFKSEGPRNLSLPASSEMVEGSHRQVLQIWLPT